MLFRSLSPTVGSSLTRSYAGYQFGAVVSGLGDFNLDGISDVVVGYIGRAIQLFRGSATGPILNTTITGSTTSFGQSIALLRRRPRG